MRRIRNKQFPILLFIINLISNLNRFMRAAPPVGQLPLFKMSNSKAAQIFVWKTSNRFSVWSYSNGG